MASVTNGIKQCIECKVDKPITDFSIKKKTAQTTYLRSECKPCNAKKGRAWRAANPEKAKSATKRWREANPEKVRAKDRDHSFRRSYGLTTQEVEGRIALQGNRCANPGCARPLSRGKKPDAAAVDHNHSTGKVRGILCQGCNSALGYLRENDEAIRGLAVYLKSHA